MLGLLESRKFRIMLADVIISSITYFVAKYINYELGQDIIWLIGTWQLVIYAVIAGIATEDAAKVVANATKDAANLTAVAAVEVASVSAKSDVAVAKLQ
jgi:hypothetical protein